MTVFSLQEIGRSHLLAGDSIERVQQVVARPPAIIVNGSCDVHCNYLQASLAAELPFYNTGSQGKVNS